MADLGNIYVTSEFIRDARCADYTLWVFGGGFNSPTDYDPTDTCTFACFTQDWITDNRSGQPVYYRLTSPTPTQSGTTYGVALYGLTTCLNEDMTRATVKIYLNQAIYNTNFGYLTYSINGFGPGTTLNDERIAFYFDRSAYIKCPAQNVEGLKQQYNDAAYITLDLSALNVAANIKPVYTEINSTECGGGFIYDHQHILNIPDQSYSLNTSCVYADAGCISNLYQTAGKERSVVVERTNRNTECTTVCNFLVAADGRFTDNLHASDYSNPYSYACIGTPTNYGLDSQKSMAKCLNYEDVIYFEDP